VLWPHHSLYGYEPVTGERGGLNSRRSFEPTHQGPGFAALCRTRQAMKQSEARFMVNLEFITLGFRANTKKASGSQFTFWV
jgi:hypothetical protein